MAGTRFSAGTWTTPSIGYREEESPTLRAGVTPGVAIEFNPTDSRIRIKDDGICQTLCSRMGTGGNCVPLTFSLPYCKGTRPHIAAIVTQYLLAADVDMSKVTDAQVDAMVNAYAEAANCDKSALKAEAVAQITEYVQAEGLKPPIITAKVQITGYDYLTYRDFQKNSGLNVEVPVRLGEVDEDELRRSATAESSGSGRTALKSPSPLCPKGRSPQIPSPPWTRTARCIS